jgi:hypothetical protein
MVALVATETLGYKLSAWLRRRGYATVTEAARGAEIAHNVLMDWIRDKRRPRPKVFWPVLDKLRIPRDDFVGLVDPPAPECKYGCGKPLNPSSIRKIRKEDPGRADFSHRDCREQAKEGWRSVACVLCPHTLLLSPSRIRTLKWKKEVGRLLYRYCGTCSRKLRSNPSRLFEGILRKRGRGIFSVSELMDRFRRGDPSAIEEVGARVRTHLRDITPRRWNRAIARPRLAKAQVIQADLRPLFTLCPECRLVVYRTEPSKPRFEFHEPCWSLFQGSDAYRRWVAQRHKGMSPPFPFPDVLRGRGRTKDKPEVLLRSYRSLMRHVAPRSLGGRSNYELATDAGVTDRAIAYRIRSFVELLPGSWDLVFQAKPTSGWRRANKVRQDLFPLPIHRGDRAALVQRLHARGMPENGIAHLTGVPLPRVQQLIRKPGPSALTGNSGSM